MSRVLRGRAAEAGEEDKKEDGGRLVRQRRVTDRFGQSQVTSSDIPESRKHHRLRRLNDNSYRPTRHQASDNRKLFRDASESDLEKSHRPRTRRQRCAHNPHTTGMDNFRAANSPSPASESSYGEAPADEVLSSLMQVAPGTLPAAFDIRTFLAAAPQKKVKKQPPPPPDVEPMPLDLWELAKEPMPAAFEESHDQIWMAGVVWLHHVLQEGNTEPGTAQTTVRRGQEVVFVPQRRHERVVWFTPVRGSNIWGCLRCLFQRALQFFTQYPRSLLNGVTDLDHSAITTRLQKIVDDIDLTVQRWKLQQTGSDSDYHPEVDTNNPRRILAGAPRVCVPNGRWSQARSVSSQPDYSDDSMVFSSVSDGADRYGVCGTGTGDYDEGDRHEDTAGEDLAGEDTAGWDADDEGVYDHPQGASH
ncbi:hypothetical protein G647_04346 [Cladophialophora carrionii CBS 160.54]|uniref:Uncharacterized protein n=1 Tax=Cladophialophora carrionii CBS 160.54 TaxID=1279043 RepID=V9DE82_9EURO|nr:uncharacterized protein G647_04346 [Cladophialophora carrionii CBS 160.54]ETI24976.1 hypothetical protein G647_04346 [Cladophialophora carrionii CBS 160.54]